MHYYLLVLLYDWSLGDLIHALLRKTFTEIIKINYKKVQVLQYVET